VLGLGQLFSSQLAQVSTFAFDIGTGRAAMFVALLKHVAVLSDNLC